MSGIIDYSVRPQLLSNVCSLFSLYFIPVTPGQRYHASFRYCRVCAFGGALQKVRDRCRAPSLPGDPIPRPGPTARHVPGTVEDPGICHASGRTVWEGEQNYRRTGTAVLYPWRELVAHLRGDKHVLRGRRRHTGQTIRPGGLLCTVPGDPGAGRLRVCEIPDLPCRTALLGI